MSLKPISTPPEVSLDFGRYVSKPILILCLPHRTKTPYWRVGVYSSGWEDEDRFDEWIDSAGFSLIDAVGWQELPEVPEVDVVRLTAGGV